MKDKTNEGVIEAFKYDGNLVYSDGTPCVPQWVFEAIESENLIWEGNEKLYVDTMREVILVSPGDYILKDDRETISTLKPDVFEKKYKKLFA